MSILSSKEKKIETERLILKTLDAEYARQVLDYYIVNRDFFKPFIPLYSSGFYTVKFHEEQLWYEYDMMKEDKSVRFYIFKKEDKYYTKIIGDICLSYILRSYSQSCKVGYKLDKEETGKGYMYETLKRIIDFVFDDLNLHRLEANIMPSNQPSIKLVKKLGFLEEGLVHDYLMINGKWEDHLRFSLINPNA